MESLQKENESLKQQLASAQERIGHLERTGRRHGAGTESDTEVVSIIVLGASGDLAKKKTFPSLFALFQRGLLPDALSIVGYARSHMADESFHKLLTDSLKGEQEKKQQFIKKCFYHQGQYDSKEDFVKLDKRLEELERKLGAPKSGNRMFYYAIPPSVFIPTSRALQAGATSKHGWTRVVVEKPFGHDLPSALELGNALAELFSEDQIYRIDHYLGKELVQALLVLRFANVAFEPLWNSVFISNVQITFKEDIGTEGRGGYFDEFGIIRDVMQNHLMQLLTLVAMEPPVSLQAEDVRNEKVKVLKAIPPVRLDDLVIGQYGPSKDKKQPGYLDDKTVPKGSITPTFASAVLSVSNQRWKGTPFILKCGKALNERKAEIRIQFRLPANGLFPDAAPNELVLRVQPGEAVYMKMMIKKPGLSNDREQVELDLSYKDRFGVVGSLPDAYERLILDVLRGDHNLFVRDDELAAAWRIFTPVLHQLEKEKIAPEVYEFGSRGPPAADELAKRSGFVRSEQYQWPGKTPGNKL
jgi:glucose-6-phosphate 1-dehydrogenase